MANIFSFPTFYQSGSWQITGYNIFYSNPTSTNAPNYFGPWNALTGYQNVLQNTDIVDTNGSYWTMYRVQPIVQATLPGGGTTSVTLPMSRPFKADDPLYDSQISSLLDTFRTMIDDKVIRQTDSTVPSESTGGAIMPFITDAVTDTFYPAFLQNADPIKLITEDIVVWQGTTKSAAAPMSQYTDFYTSDFGGYVKFATIPAANNYLRIEYSTARFTNDECRSALLNAVSSLSLYGINGYGVSQSNNLCYLSTPLPNRDLAEILCLIAYNKILNGKVMSSFEHAEAWKDGKVEYTADPSRSIQAATMHVTNLGEELRHRASQYIYASRTYQSRGEFESYFDVTGTLPVYTMIVSGFDASSFGLWWI